MFARSAWNPPLAIGLLNMHVLALAAVVGFTPRPLDVALMFAGYLWFGFASSLYYHRFLTHKGFKLALPLQWFFLAGGLIGLSGDPVRWAATHRYHHARPDDHDDLHSPNDGWWYAHFGWLAKLDMAWVETIRGTIAPDLRKIWWLKCWENPWLAIAPHFAYGALLFVIGGGGALTWDAAWAAYGTVLWGLYVPIVASFHFGWMMIASFCHLPQFGYRSTETPAPDMSRNLWWLGPFSFGESFHNHHHAYPRRAKHGVEWWEPDPSKYLLWTFEQLGLASDICWDHAKKPDGPEAAWDAATVVPQADPTPAGPR